MRAGTAKEGRTGSIGRDGNAAVCNAPNPGPVGSATAALLAPQKTLKESTMEQARVYYLQLLAKAGPDQLAWEYRRTAQALRNLEGIAGLGVRMWALGKQAAIRQLQLKKERSR